MEMLSIEKELKEMHILEEELSLERVLMAQKR